MKKCIVSLAFILTAHIAAAAVIDAPHNAISCATCHSYSLWWQYSPSSQSPAPKDHTAIVDAVCMTCHKDGIGDLPKASTHSSAVIDSDLHGSWGVGCTACHNPHSQDQLEWVGSETEPYLVTGTITAVSYDSGLGQSTVSYANATENQNWPAVGALDGDPGWANKSLSNPNRGLILVHDKTNAFNTYSIVSATTDQVVIKGELTPDAVNPEYINPQTHVQNPATCNTFGLIYGQLIKATIASKPVKFFTPRGGFVKEGANPTGICQVCHTDTAHFTNSGVLPSGADSHTGRETGNCTSCHKHNAGFKGNGHDSTSFAWAGNCATCHDPDHSIENIVTEIHGRSCGICHVDPAGGGPRRDGDAANGIDGSALGATNASTCVDCHLVKLGLSGGAIHHVSASGYAAAGNCTQCHQDAAGKLAADHSALVGSDSNCTTTCHAGTAGTAAGAPVNPADPKIHDACATCHENNGSLKAAYGKASAMPGGGGNCEACHGAYFVRHMNINHVSRVASSSDCGSCHPGTAGTATTVPVDANDNKVHDSCSTCHNTDGSLRSAYGKAVAMPAGGGACEACHISATSQKGGLHHGSVAAANNNCATCHPSVDHSSTVPTTSACTTCHTATAGTVSGMPVSLSDAAVHDSCRTCHTFDANKNGVLVNFTNHKGVNGNSGTRLPAGGGACTVCHTVAATTNMANLGVLHHTSYRAAQGQCEYCHADPMPSWSATVPGDNGTASGLTPAWPTQMACRECHMSFSGGTMTVAKFTRTDYSNYSTDWTRTTAHSIPMTGTSINNYGICLGCHFVGSSKVPASAQVTIWHARPDKHGGSLGWAFYNQTSSGTLGKTNYRSSCGVDDIAHYLPGRSSSGIGGFNIFAPNYGLYENPFGSSSYLEGSGHEDGNCSKTDPYSVPRASAPFIRITLPALTQLGTTSPQAVPVFASIAPASASSPAADNITVSSASWDGTYLSVTATTSGTCANLSVWTLPDNTNRGAMTGTTTCTATIPVVSQPTAIDVVSSRDGVPVKGFPVADNSAPGPGAIWLPDSLPSVAENGGTVTITATRTGGSVGAVGVSFATSNGTALAGADYIATSGTLSWADGEAGSKTFTISINNDSSAEGDETVNMALSAPTGGATILGSKNSAVLTIVDPPGAIAFTAPTYTVAENGGTATITASRTGGAHGAVGVSFAASNGTASVGSDYMPASGSLSWGDGESGNKTFTVSIINNVLVEADETVNLALTSPTGGATLGARNTALLTITNDDTGVVELDPWTNIDSEINVSSGEYIAGSFAVGSGSQRLLLVAVVMKKNGISDPVSVSAYYGEQSLTPIGITTGSSGESIWMGYLKEGQIGSGSNDLSIYPSVGGTGIISGMHVKWASYAAVNQANPAVSFTSWSGNSATAYFGALPQFNPSGRMVIVSGNSGSATAGTLTLLASSSSNFPYTAGPMEQSSGQTSKAFTTGLTLDYGYFYNDSVVWSGGTPGSYSALMTVSLLP